MKRGLTAILAIALVVSSLFAEVKIQGDAKVKLHNFVELSASGAVPGAAFLWRVYGPDGKRITDGKQVKTSKESLCFVGPAGVYRVELLSAFYDEKTKQQSFSEDLFTVTIGDGKPEPGPGPGPGPTPNPDTPAPIPLAGLRVLIIYETKDATTLPAGQQGILFGKAFRDLLNTSCVAGSDGKTKEWRIWDKDVALDGAEAHWVTAMKRTRTSVPWILISNGKTGYEGPLPASVDEATTLIKKYKE